MYSMMSGVTNEALSHSGCKNSLHCGDTIAAYCSAQSKSDLLNEKLLDATNYATLAETNLNNISRAIVNIPVYSTTVSVLNSNGVVSKSSVTNHLISYSNGRLDDETELKNILNINGNEEYTINNNKR